MIELGGRKPLVSHCIRLICDRCYRLHVCNVSIQQTRVRTCTLPFELLYEVEIVDYCTTVAEIVLFNVC
jgi:hypothetical protein